MAGNMQRGNKDKIVYQAGKGRSAMAGNKAEQEDGRRKSIKLFEVALKKHKLTPLNIPRFLKVASAAGKSSKVSNQLESFKEMSELADHVDGLAEYITKTKEIQDFVSEIRGEAVVITKQKPMTPQMDVLTYCLALQAIVAFLGGAVLPFVKKMKA